MLKEFKEFALKGSVLDMAIGIIIGGAFMPIVKSLVDDLLMPVLGMLTGGADFSGLYILLKEGAAVPGPYASLALAKEAGAATLSYGLFINAVVNFVLVAVAVFIFIKVINRWRRQPEQAPTTKECPHCLTQVALAATRCPACTSELTV